MKIETLPRFAPRAAIGADDPLMLITTERTGIKVVGLEATPVGTTDTSVLEFSGLSAAIGPVSFAQWATRNAPAAEAVNGTIITIFQRGIYAVRLYLRGLAIAGAVEAGIGRNIAATPAITFDPDLSVPEIIANGVMTTTTLNSIALEALVQVSQQQNTTIRFLATAGGTVLDATTLNLPECGFMIERIGDCQGAA